MLAKTKKQQPNKTTKQAKDPQDLTFLDHLRELRSRLFWIVFTLLIASSIAFVFKDPLIAFIVAPLQGQQLVYLTVGGGFSFIFTVCMYAGAILSIPVIVYHLYRFVQPVIANTSRRLIVNLVLASSVLAVAGAAFGYFFAIQASLEFLLGFAGGTITSSVTAESYLNFIIMYTAGLAAVFQLPLLLYVIDHVRPFPPGSLLSSQRYVIVGAVIVAALITPTPDVINQMIIAIPVIVIYQFGAVAVYLRHRAIRRRQKTAPVSIDMQPTVPIESLVTPQAPAPRPQMVRPTFVAATARPILAPSPARPVVSSRPRRSMDGMMRNTRQPRPLPVVQPRINISAPMRRPLRHSMPTTQPSSRFRRTSVDGLSFI